MNSFINNYLNNNPSYLAKKYNQQQNTPVNYTQNPQQDNSSGTYLYKAFNSIKSAPSKIADAIYTPINSIYVPIKKLYKNPAVVSTVAIKVDRTFSVKDKHHNKKFVWKNDLKQLFQQDKAVIYALVIRTFNAKDKDGDGLIDSKGEKRGTFINAVDRLDELKSMGINTLHLLPIHPLGKKGGYGTAGSLYGPSDFLTIDPNLADPNSPLSLKDQTRFFVKECHKRGIRVMLDMPSCTSIDFAEKHHDLIAYDNHGNPKIPQAWQGVRMFKYWTDKDKKILNKKVLDYHYKYIDFCLGLGVDGIRADIARAKPPKFWKKMISYARSKNPNFAFLAETYTYEDAPSIANIPSDRPEAFLKAGFDSIYGQYHIFPQWSKASQLHNYVKKMIKMSYRVPPNKSLIGSFATHDDKSPMSDGGVPYCNMTTGIQATLPMLNPYFVSGFESGDRYIYPYKDKPSKSSDTECKRTVVHSEQLDIFNYSRKPGGNHPEIENYMSKIFKVRKKFEDVITRGSYIPLKVDNNKEDHIIAYARYYKGKTLLAIANKNVNGYESGYIKIPTLKKTQKLIDLSPGYSMPSRIKVTSNGLDVKLGPARFHLFEINTPNIEKHVKEVFKPNQKLPKDNDLTDFSINNSYSDMFKLYYMFKKNQMPANNAIN